MNTVDYYRCVPDLDELINQSNICGDEEKLDLFKEIIEEEINLISSLSNYKTLFDMENRMYFYDFYGVYLGDKEYKELLHMKTGRSYFIELLSTTMIYYIKETYGDESWEEPYRVGYEMAILNDENSGFKYKRYYTKEDIENLVSKGSFIIKKREEAVNIRNPEIEEEYNINFDDTGCSVDEFINENEDIYDQFLKNHLSSQRHYKTLKNYIKKLLKEINNFLFYYQQSEELMEIEPKSVKLCRDWYTSNNIYKEIKLIK